MIKIKNKSGILFPARINADKKILIKMNTIKYKSFLFLNLKKIGNKKSPNKENLWMKEPAIISSPKGPDNLLSIASNPKISLPNIN